MAKRMTDLERVRDSLNCYQIASIYVYLHGGKMIYGQAVNPADGRTYQHTWVGHNDQLIDLCGWTDHELKGNLDVNDPTLARQTVEAIDWLKDERLIDVFEEVASFKYEQDKYAAQIEREVETRQRNFDDYGYIGEDDH